MTGKAALARRFRPGAAPSRASAAQATMRESDRRGGPRCAPLPRRRQSGRQTAFTVICAGPGVPQAKRQRRAPTKPEVHPRKCQKSHFSQAAKTAIWVSAHLRCQRHRRPDDCVRCSHARSPCSMPDRNAHSGSDRRGRPLEKVTEQIRPRSITTPGKLRLVIDGDRSATHRRFGCRGPDTRVDDGSCGSSSVPIGALPHRCDRPY